MAPDHGTPILKGPGDSDYARYMRTDALLDLVRRPDQWVHRDEVLFQVVHQSCELWLHLVRHEAAEAAQEIRRRELASAEQLLGRASLALGLITDQLEMLTKLSPQAFQLIRQSVLGHGSGAESPGWIALNRVGRELEQVFTSLVSHCRVDLGEMYRGRPDTELYRLAEAMVDFDERVALWRVRHYKVATRVIGHDVVGTKGMPVERLTRLISRKYFPTLWQVRTQLTLTGPMGDIRR